MHNSVSKRDPEVKFYTCMERKTCRGRVHAQDGKFLNTVTEYSLLADKNVCSIKLHWFGLISFPSFEDESKWSKVFLYLFHP